MRAYCALTGTLSTKALLIGAGWRWLVTPQNCRKNMRDYALDNGAWGSYQQKRPFDAEAFEKAVTAYGAEADFIVLPDIVMGGARSLALSVSYVGRLSTVNQQLLIPVQNGMALADIAPLLNQRIGIFLGGDTEWKLETGHAWGKLAYTANCYYHVGRVNTARRILWCSSIGADSFDGSSVARFPSTLTLLENARKQPSVFRKNKIPS